jgi:SAM-dependent methyltransferase
MLTLAAGRGAVALADGHRLPLAGASVDAAVTVDTLEFTADPGAVLAEMARVTRPGGLLVAAVLNPASPWGLLDRPARRVPYAGGCFLPRASLLGFGRRHGQARLQGVLFAAGRLPARRLLGPALEAAGKLIPRLGAFQVLTVLAGETARCGLTRDSGHGERTPHQLMRSPSAGAAQPARHVLAIRPEPDGAVQDPRPPRGPGLLLVTPVR